MNKKAVIDWLIPAILVIIVIIVLILFAGPSIKKLTSTLFSEEPFGELGEEVSEEDFFSNFVKTYTFCLKIKKTNCYCILAPQYSKKKVIKIENQFGKTTFALVEGDVKNIGGNIFLESKSDKVLAFDTVNKQSGIINDKNNFIFLGEKDAPFEAYIFYDFRDGFMFSTDKGKNYFKPAGILKTEKGFLIIPSSAINNYYFDEKGELMPSNSQKKLVLCDQKA